MIESILELRRRFIIVAMFFVSCFFLCYHFSDEVFQGLMMPLQQLLPDQESLIATRMTTPILIPLTLAGDVALLCSAPLALFHLFRFIAPGLYQQERQGLGLLIVLSMALFCIGVLFCFFGVLPFMFQCFIHSVPKNVHLMPEITSSLDFIMRMMLLFGFCFQVPLGCILLVKTKMIEKSALKKARPYWIVSAFILGMLLTPPDVLSQITLAIPLCLLYELGIILSGRW
jgi:sec-independent protein translocase protein TatC